MPKKTTAIKSKKPNKKRLKSKSKKRVGKIAGKKKWLKPLLIASISSVALLSVIALIVCFIVSSNKSVPCMESPQVLETCKNNDGESSSDVSEKKGKDKEDIGNDSNVNTDNDSATNKDSEGSRSSSDSGGSSNSGHSSSSTTNSTPQGSNADQPSSQSSGESLKVGSSYMGGTIPRLLDIPTCFGPTLCAWILDGSEYANIYMTEDYHWGGRFLDIVNGNLVTSEKNHWAPSTNKYFYSENIPKLFSSDMVTMAKNYGLREINKKLYLTINGVTYSFHSGYTSVKPNPTLSVPGGSFSMPPNSQIDFDINVSPWFYDPEIFDKNYYPYIYNTNVVKFVKLVKKSDGILTITLKSGDYKHGASTGITLYGVTYVVTITGH